jgi:hypothetical protein
MKNYKRAIGYRRLGVTERDECKAAFLRKLAEEAERGLLCTVDQMYGSSNRRNRQGGSR